VFISVLKIPVLAGFDSNRLMHEYRRFRRPCSPSRQGEWIALKLEQQAVPKSLCQCPTLRGGVFQRWNFQCRELSLSEAGR
jgi:hypothetical protein